MTTGFLGTRADALVDLTVVFFLAAPFLMLYAVRLAARGRHRAHRNLQAGLVVAGVVAVLILELSIRYGGAMAAYAQSSYYGKLQSTEAIGYAREIIDFVTDQTAR